MGKYAITVNHSVGDTIVYNHRAGSGPMFKKTGVISSVNIKYNGDELMIRYEVATETSRTHHVPEENVLASMVA